MKEATGISLFALLVSAISLGWNIYRDVILKARVKVRFSLSSLYNEKFKKPMDFLVLTATNFGPGRITLNMITLMEAPLWRRLLRCQKTAVMIYDYENPFSTRLPIKIEVGDKAELLIRWEKECFLGKPTTHIGLSDSFGRVHWAPAADVRKARAEYRNEFLDENNKNPGKK